MTDYYVAIPSYRRPELCAQTVSILNANGITPGVFLSDWEENNAYLAAMKDLGAKAELIEGAPGIVGNRNAISETHGPDARIVSVDDDITKVHELRHGKLGAISHAEFFDFAWEMCRTGLWGVNPTGNPFYMRAKIKVGWTFAIGCLHGYVNDKSLPPLSIETKEDYERSALFMERDGAVTRFDMFTTNNRYAKTEGGLGTDRDGRNEAAVVALLERWPHLFKPKSGTEVALKRL